MQEFQTTYFYFAGHLADTMDRLRLARRWATLAVTLVVLVAGAGAGHPRDRGSKARGVNGGSIFFDAQSGEFRRHGESGEVEVIRRTPVRTLHNGGVVSKVLKRRKKYRRLPSRRADADQLSDVGGDHNDNNDNSDDKPQLREINESFEKLKPLKTKYKTSDSIRMHIKTPHQDDKISRASLTSRHENKRNNLIENTNDNKKRPEVKKQPLELSDNFKFKQKMKKPSKMKKKSHQHYTQQVGAESREKKTYKRFYGSHEEVLLASGYHNSLSIQEPVQNSVAEGYDFTIGKITLCITSSL